MAMALRVELGDCVLDSAVEVIGTVERLMCEVMPLQVAPEGLDVVQLRGILRQPLDREPVGALGEGGAGRLAGVDRAVIQDEHERLGRNPELGTIAPIDLLQESDEVRASFGPAGAHDELATRPVEPPSIATLALWPGAGMRRSVPLLAQTCARYGWVSASDSSPNRSTMSPASAWALSSFRRRPARSTASASWRPFSVWRGRRQRKSPFGGAHATAARARCARPRASRSRRPTATASSSGDPLQAQTGPPRPHSQGTLGFDGRWP